MITAAVIDCSALAELLLAGGSNAIREHAELGDTLLAVPHLIDVEFTSVMRKLALRRPGESPELERVLHEFADLRLHRFEHEPLRRFAWDRRSEMSSYDAMYVALARELRLPLVTADERLAIAAERWCETVTLRQLDVAAGATAEPR